MPICSKQNITQNILIYSEVFFLIYFAMTLDSVCVCVCVCDNGYPLSLCVTGTYLLFFIFETVPCVSNFHTYVFSFMPHKCCGIVFVSHYLKQFICDDFIKGFLIFWESSLVQ